MSNRIRNSIVLLTLTVIILTVWKVAHGHSNNQSASGGIPPSMVTVATAVLQPWQQQIPATGTLTAMQGVMMKSEVAGRITKIYVDSGADVNAGDPLVDIDPGMMQAQLASAIAKANLSSDYYNRALDLTQKGALSKQDLDTALSNKNSDAAVVQQYQAQLAQYQIHAPFSGRLGLRQFNLGDYITAGQALVNLQQLDPLRVDFTIPENFLSLINVGDAIQIQSDTLPDQIVKGSVSAIDSAIDPTTRTIALRATVPNPQQKLLPGGFVQVTLLAGKPQMLVTIPQIAVVFDPTGSYVYTVVNQHAVKTSITIAQQNNTQVAVSAGLKANDQVVSAGQLKIGDGLPVMIAPPSK
jgi:membrane fusion protein (multidrug efflux system)